MLLFVLLLAILGMAAVEQANATKPTSSKDKEKFAYGRIFSAKIPNELDKPLDELEAIARQYGTEEVAMFHKSVGPEKQVDRWIIRQGSEPYDYPPGLTVKARSHLARQRQMGALRMRGRGRAETVIAEQRARLQWVLPETVRSPLLCDIYEDDKLVAVNTIHERLSPSKKQRWPNVIRINLPQRDWSIIQVFEYLDEEPEGLASLQQGLYEEPAQELHPTRQIPAKASVSGKKKDPAVESSGTTIVKTESASFNAFWPDWGFEWDYSTGWKPRRCPVQVKFEAHTAAKLSSSVWGGEFELHYDSGDYDEANLVLTGGSGQGNLEINFGIEMSTKGRVKVDLGLKEVDFRFNIPYAPNFDLRCYDFNSFEGYFLDSSNSVEVEDSVEPQTLFSGPIAGIPSIAEITASVKADMVLSAKMWADSITTGPISGDANSAQEYCTFTGVDEVCDVNVSEKGDYLTWADYNEHLDMDMVVSVYPNVCVEVDIWIYDWEYCVSTFAIRYKLASGTVDLEFGYELYFEPSYDLVITSSYGAISDPAPGVHPNDVTEITLDCDPNELPVATMHTWNDTDEPLMVDVNAVTVTDPNYEFDYWILDGNEDSNTTCSVEFDSDSNIWFHLLHAVFYRAKATEPFPSDRADKIGKVPTLSWWPGEYAVSQDVYFGTDYNDVNDAGIIGSPVYRGPQLPADANFDPCDFPEFEELGDCVTYYWRIDEVNDSHPNSPWKGTTWCFRTDGCCATKPTPIDGAPDEPRNLCLVWKNGACVVTTSGHHLYLGTNYNDVEDADPCTMGLVHNDLLDPNSYQVPEDERANLLPTTYYWRVDEGNSTYSSRVPDPWKGEVWEFTAGHIVVDDFEPYDDTTELRNTWRDPCFSGGEIFLWADANYVHGGKQSMKYMYDNNSFALGYFSEIEADATGLNSVASTINGDWTTADVKALVLQYYGEPNDDTTDDDRIYVALEDNASPIPHIGVAKCDREASDVNEVNLDLYKFEEQGVDLTNIKKVYIGFGDPCKIHPEWFSSSLPDPCELASSGTGTVWFDDIRLYPPRCRPEMVRDKGDFSGDCYVNLIDLAIIVNDWLMSNYYAIPVQPPLPLQDPNLLVEYKFDSGFNDTSDWGYHGESWGDAVVSGGVLQLRGLGRVNVAPDDFNEVNPFDGLRDFSIAIAFKTSKPGILISSSGDDDPLNHSMAVFVTPTLSRKDTVVRAAVVYGNYYVDTITAEDNPLNNQWHHAAVTYDAKTNTHRLYLDGAAAPRRVFDPNIPYIEQDTVCIGGSFNPDFPGVNNFDGDINSVRIYKRVLSPDEICYLANEAAGFDPIDPNCYHPLISPANIVDHLLDYDLSKRRTKQVNFRDYKELADNWLKELLWPEEE